jgi:hypothetical protein
MQPNMVEEGLKRLSPSSLEISFPAEPAITLMMTLQPNKIA